MFIFTPVFKNKIWDFPKSEISSIYGKINAPKEDFRLLSFLLILGEVFDYLVAHGRMKEKEARAKFRQV